MLLGGANSQGGVWLYVPALHFVRASLTSSSYLWHSFLPSWIGNAIGAALITVPMMCTSPARYCRR